MARTGIEKLIEEGEVLTIEKTARSLYADEIIGMIEKARQGKGYYYTLIGWIYHAGVAAGYRARKREEKKKRDRIKKKM